jgi:outer membrane phospholipase A
MASTRSTPPKEDAVHQMEYVKTKDTAVFKGVSADKQQLYLSYTARDDEWKAYNTKKLLRKVDIRLLPLLILMYLLNFLDRSNLAQARLGTLEKDLGMKGTDFNLATSILFVVSDTKVMP